MFEEKRKIYCYILFEIKGVLIKNGGNFGIFIIVIEEKISHV